MGIDDSGLPGGTVTFVLGDVVGSARLWEDHPDEMPGVLARLDEIVDGRLAAGGGGRPAEQGEGDNFVAVFARADAAAAFAVDVARDLAGELWPAEVVVSLRMALHTGDARLRDGGRYMGGALNRCARIRALGHGGQVLLSRATADLVVDQLDDGAFLRDLGIHHLRDLSRPERVAQLCATGLAFDFPPLRSLARLPNNLPVQVTSFVGRGRELVATGSLLADHRMVTLTGAGGCGKTRLAIQLAAEVLERFPGGVWLADLSPLAEPELVAKSVAAAAGCRDVPGQSPTETVVEWLRDAEALVVVDNCEHLLDPAVEVTEALLAGCPGVRVLATSREPLGAAGETTYRVPSLTVPAGSDSGDAYSDRDCESVRLFADRAAQARPSLQVDPSNLDAVAAICTRLDGIPLAIELAAARCRVMSPAQIAQQLADRFSLLSGGRRAGMPRQRTLEASVDWSYALLTDDERRLLRLLSVFAGGFTLDAVEACWEAPLGTDGWEAVELLAGLVDKSLVQPPDDAAVERHGKPGDTEPRYRQLETIRQYAATKLIDAGEAAAARQRHAEHYAAVAETVTAGLTGPDMPRSHATMVADLDNFRATDDWAAETGQADIALRLGWREIGSPYGPEEASRRMARALALDGGSPTGRVRTMLGLGEMLLFLGESGMATVKALWDDATRLAAEIGDDELRGQAVGTSGWGAWAAGDGTAVARLTEGATLLRAIGSGYWASDALWGLGMAAVGAGDVEAARRHLTEAMELTRAAGSAVGIGRSLGLLGLEFALEGDLEAAGAALAEARLLLAGGNEVFMLGVTEACLAFVDAARGETGAALLRSTALAEEARRRHHGWWAAWSLWASTMAESRGAREGGAPCPSAPRADEATLAHGLTWAAAWCRAIRAEDQLAAGDPAAARALATSAVELAEGAIYGRRSLGRALLAWARLARAEGDPAGAEDVAQRALAAAASAGARHHTVEALEVLAGLAADQAAPADAARLFAAASAAREYLGYPQCPADAVAAADLQRARLALPTDAFEAAWAEGSSVPLDDAVAYASRGRGARKRPSSGWAALSPTEVEVVRLVAAGLRNKDVAAKLFVAPSTVKTHLAHAFAKLGVSNRAELAALATRREG